MKNPQITPLILARTPTAPSVNEESPDNTTDTDKDTNSTKCQWRILGNTTDTDDQAPRVTMLVKVVMRAEKSVTVLPVCCQLKRQGKLEEGAEVEEGMAEGIVQGSRRGRRGRGCEWGRGVGRRGKGGGGGGSSGGRPKTVSNEPGMKLLADNDTARVSAPTFTPHQMPGPSVPTVPLL